MATSLAREDRESAEDNPANSQRERMTSKPSVGKRLLKLLAMLCTSISWNSERPCEPTKPELLRRSRGIFGKPDIAAARPLAGSLATVQPEPVSPCCCGITPVLNEPANQRPSTCRPCPNATTSHHRRAGTARRDSRPDFRLAAVGTICQRTLVGDGPRGLQRRRRCLGLSCRTISPRARRIAGAKTASPESAIASSFWSSPPRSGTAAIRFSRSGCLGSRHTKAITART